MMKITGVRLIHRPGLYDVYLKDSMVERIETYQPSDNKPLIDDIFLLPGLIDSHVHVSYLPGESGFELIRSGVLCVRDVGGYPEKVKAWARNSMLLPKVIYYGQPLDGQPPEAHSRMFGAVGVTSIGDVKRYIRKVKLLAANGIKLYFGFPQSIVSDTIELAHNENLKVAAHLGSGTLRKFHKVPSEIFAQLGGDTLEHVHSFTGSLISPRLLKKHAANYGLFHPFTRVFLAWRDIDLDSSLVSNIIEKFVNSNCGLVPTLGAIASAGNCLARDNNGNLFLKKPLDIYQNAASIEGFHNMLGFINRLNRAGGKLLAGTDIAGANEFIKINEALQLELKLFLQAGLDPLDVIKTVTEIPANVLDMKNHGKITVGAIADLIAFRAKSLGDVINTWEVKAVVKSGNTVYGKLL